MSIFPSVKEHRVVPPDRVLRTLLIDVRAGCNQRSKAWLECRTKPLSVKSGSCLPIWRA